jgi:3-keto-5-aminohexanoate cleavage enzyme
MGSVNFNDDVCINRLPDIRYWAKRIRRTRTVPEMEIFLFDSGMLPAAHAIELSLDPRPRPESLFFMTPLMKETVPWGVIHDGLTDLTLLATAIAMGAPLVRVGFEDSIFWTPDQAVERNVELVQTLTQRVRLLGHAVATPPEARAILGIRRI